MTLSPTFAPSTTRYTAELEQAANVSESFNITAGTSNGQSVTYSIGRTSSANIPAQITTVGANKALTIGNGNMHEGDTGTVFLLAKVSHTSTSRTKTYCVEINVTVTEDEIVDVETSD